MPQLYVVLVCLHLSLLSVSVVAILPFVHRAADLFCHSVQALLVLAADDSFATRKAPAYPDIAAEGSAPASEAAGEAATEAGSAVSEAGEYLISHCMQCQSVLTITWLSFVDDTA